MSSAHSETGATVATSVAPLLGRCDPIPGESLMSLIARTCVASGFRNLSTVLSSIGVNSRPPFVPFTRLGAADEISTLLRVAPVEVTARMHSGTRDTVDWFGTPLRRSFIEATERRYSPESLRQSAHHRASWMLRPLAYCPSSFELLSSSCPQCRRSMGWDHTRGTDRCEFCLAWLTDWAPEKVPFVDRIDAARVAGIIAVDSVERDRAKSSLPAPFNTWASGSLFEAIVELGVAVDRLVQGGEDGGAIILSDGRYQAISAQTVVSGIRFIDGWPQTLTTFLDDVGKSANVAGSAALRSCLGPLGKFAAAHQAKSPLAMVIAEEAATAFRAARVPVKSTALSRISRAADDGLISEKEILAEFPIYQKHLRRLDDSSEALVLRRASVTKLYDRQRLERSVTAFRAAVPASQVSRSLGVPAYCLKALANAGLLELEIQEDAIRLSGEVLMVTRRSQDALLSRVCNFKVIDADQQMALSKAMRHILAPDAWAASITFALSSGRVLDHGAEAALVDRLAVDPGSLSVYLMSRRWPLPGHVGVSCITAGKLVGQSDVLVGKAMAAGVIGGEAGNQRHSIRLSDLRDFSQCYTFSNEIAERLGCSSRAAGKQLEAAGLQPAHMVHRMALWDRSEAEQAVGLEASWQHQLIQVDVCP